MRACAALVVVSFVALAGAPAAHAAPVARHNLSWESSRVVGDGLTGKFRSNDRCPERHEDGSPIQGTREVFVTVSFSFGGAMTQGPIPVAANGGWSADIRFLVDHNVHDSDAHVSAECDDVTFTAVRLASYRPHRIVVNPG